MKSFSIQKLSREQANQFARRYVALGFYKQNGVSIGYCSQIAGMTEEEFIKYLLDLKMTQALAVSGGKKWIKQIQYAYGSRNLIIF